MSTSHGSSARERSTTVRHVCSGRCPGVWIARRDDVAELELGAVLERLVRVLGLGGRVDRDRDAVLERQPPVAGEMVGVRVRLDASARSGRRAARPLASTRLDRKRRIDDRGDAGVLVADQVRGAAEVVVEELLEQHEQ